MVTQAIQRRLCTVSELARELAATPRNGSGFLRRALVDVENGAESIAEAEAVELLRRPDIPPFEVNAPIRDGGRIVAIADVLWRKLRAVLEIDSREYHLGEAEWKATMRRHNALTRRGFAVAHYAPSEIRGRRKEWADEVAHWLRARARELSA
ncbi:MAG: hypothetical protein JWO57_1072 [Pseudonocardiales bacterium]|nr:hypothetical protein [Pseudonocardiales bacterium]